MTKFRLILRTTPIIFIVFTSAFFGVLFLAPNGGSNAMDEDSPAITGNKDIGTSDTIITKSWQAVETLESWWNSVWAYRKKITITEPSFMDREREPVDIYLTFTGYEARVNSIRLTLYNGSSNTWYEVPSQVWNVTTINNGTANFYSRCSVMFLLNMTKADSEIYYVYYDPYYATAPTYTDRITVRGANDPAITDDTNNPSMTHSNGTTYSNIDSFQIITNGNFASPRAKVCLVDTMRQGSDWGGPACSIFSALQGANDVFNIAQQTWMSVGEMALQASSTADPFSEDERCNVGPDNPREAWDLAGGRPVIVLDDGPLFVRIRIQTTDGAYANLVTTPGAGTWHRDAILGTATDSVNRGTSGSLGYVKYNITYTFFYYGIQTFAKIDLDIISAPQRGPIGSGYPVTNAAYPRVTSAYFKNYGDWPHLGQLVRASTGTVSQDRKAWLGAKYSPDGVTVYNMPIADRRRDYPTEPWTAWYDTTNTAATIGMFAITNSIGWEVTSLAVGGIGPNSLLQQILPEGHQGDIFNLTKGTTLKYDYYLLTSAAGTNWSIAQDTCRRMNKPVSIVVSSRELFSNNAMFIHVNDRAGTTALGVRVIVNNSDDSQTLNSTWVNSVGNTTHLRFLDGTYHVYVEMFTPNTNHRYIVNSQSITLNHLVPAQRIVYRTYNTNMANLTIRVVNQARNNELLSGAQVRILNGTTLIEQVYAFGAAVTFRLLSIVTGTAYNIQVWYGALQRGTNLTNPYTLLTNTNLNIGALVETTALNIISQPTSVGAGTDYTIVCNFTRSDNSSILYRPDNIKVSTGFLTGYWTETTDFDWSYASNQITIDLKTGAGTKLATTGAFEAYIYAMNATVENATFKTFVIIDPISTDIKVFVNGTDISTGGTFEIRYTESFKVDVQYSRTAPATNITTGTVWMTNTTTGNWTLAYAGGNWSRTIDSDTLGTANQYSFVITCTSPTFETQVFKFTIFTRPVQSELRVYNPSYPGFLERDTITLNWSDQTTFHLTFWDTTNNIPIPQSGSTMEMVIGTSRFTATIENGTSYYIIIHTELLPVLVGGTTLITFQANNPSYFLSEFIFNLYTKPIETKVKYSVNGLTQSGLDSTTFAIGSSLTFQVQELTWDNVIVTGAMARITYNNDTNATQPDIPLALTPIGNNYSNSMVLNINTFYALNQFFYLQVERENYTSIVQPITIRVAPVTVNVSIKSGGAVGNTLTVDVNKQINFSISLDPAAFATKFRQNLSSFVVTLNVPYLQKNFPMTHAGNGVYWVLIDGPTYESENVITVQIWIPQASAALQLQYDIQTSYTFFISARSPTGGIPPWLFWTVFGGLLAIVVWFLAYQIRFKYPPMIRKIMDLKRSVARGKVATRISAQKVRSREEGIYHFYANVVNAYSFLQTRDTRYASKAAGYAPVPDESISLDFELKAIDQPEMELPAAPVPKGMMKKGMTTSYAEPPVPTTVPGATPGIPRPSTKPAPLSLETPAIKPAPTSMPVMKPLTAKPGVMQVTRPLGAPAGVPPGVSPTIKPLPKPTAGLRPSVPAPKPAALGGMQDQVKPENLYQELVLLEQKRYKAERSMRDLDAKHARGTITDAEYNEYQKRIQESLDKLKENIAQLRRKMLSF